MSMDRKHFRGILRKYLQRRATPKEKDLIDGWYAQMEKDLEADPENAVDPALGKMYWSSIHSHIKKEKVRLSVNWRPIGIAASLLVAALASLFLILDKKTLERNLVENPAGSPAWREVFNSGTSPQYITLTDGSVISLEPQSRLRFPSKFSESERPVFLEGEAFFDVARNEESPFFVHTSGLTTKVLGTSFRVTAYAQNKRVTVAVKTGKVSVSARTEAARDQIPMPEIVLTPNQQIVFDTEKKKLARMIVAEPQAILPAEEVRKMRFESASVTEIFTAIEKVYGVDLVFDTERFSSCVLTSVISDGELYNRLDIICEAIGATYSLKENQIVIDGRGCDFQ